MIRAFCTIVACLPFLVAGTAVAAESGPAKAPLALVGSVAVTDEDLETIIGSELAELRQQEAQLREKGLEEAIARRVLEDAAKARGVTPEALLQTEVEANVAVTEAEVRGFYEANKGQLGGMPEADALARVEAGLRQQKARGATQAFLAELRKKAGVTVLLEPQRTPISTVGPFRGPADAPVTIVEFSDFQCPFCERVQPALRQVFDTYKDKVRLVYRDFPLEMHADAGRAAAAATCAGEQGKFWEMHEKIFTNQLALAASRLTQYAGEIGVDAGRFETCMADPRHQAVLEASMDEAKKAGVRGTPAFFINGRMVVGAQPFEAFARVIDDELARHEARAAKGSR